MRTLLATLMLGATLVAPPVLAEGLATDLSGMPLDAAGSNPFDAVTLNNMAVKRADKGDYSVAIMLLERASRLAPDRKDISDNLAELKVWTRDNQAGAVHDNGLGEPPALWSAKAASSDKPGKRKKP